VTGDVAITLTTPEGVELDVPLATVRSRAIAFVIDLFIILVIGLLLSLIGAVTSGSEDSGAWAVILLGLFFVRHGYFAWFEARWNGTTPGKRAMGIRVMPRDGGTLELGAVLARNILRDIELLLPLVAVFAPEVVLGASPAWLAIPSLAWIAVFAAMPLLTRERLRAGDLVAGTVVVRLPVAALLPDEAAITEAKISFSAKHLSVYGERELETLAEVLRAAEQDTIGASDLRVIAETIATKVGYTGMSPERRPRVFLRAFYRAQRAELERRLVRGKRKADKLDRS